MPKKELKTMTADELYALAEKKEQEDNEDKEGKEEKLFHHTLEDTTVQHKVS